MEVRHPRFFNGVSLEKYWMNHNPFGTYLVCGYNIIFPELERYFIRSVKKYSKHLPEGELKEQVRIFVGQEAEHMHSTVQFLKAMPPCVGRRTKFFCFIHKYIVKAAEKAMSVWPKLNLAVTAAMEQFTATIAEMPYNSKLVKDAPEPVIALLRWHAVEEIEHKAVAFDVFKKSGGGYFARIAGFFIAVLLLYGMGNLFTLAYVFSDTELYRRPLWTLGRLAEFLRRWGGFMFRQVPQGAAYPRHGFHPNDVNHPFVDTGYVDTQAFAAFVHERQPLAG